MRLNRQPRETTHNVSGGSLGVGDARLPRDDTSSGMHDALEMIGSDEAERGYRWLLDGSSHLAHDGDKRLTQRA